MRYLRLPTGAASLVVLYPTQDTEEFWQEAWTERLEELNPFGILSGVPLSALVHWGRNFPRLHLGAYLHAIRNWDGVLIPKTNAEYYSLAHCLEAHKHVLPFFVEERELLQVYRKHQAAQSSAKRVFALLHNLDEGSPAVEVFCRPSRSNLVKNLMVCEPDRHQWSDLAARHTESGGLNLRDLWNVGVNVRPLVDLAVHHRCRQTGESDRAVDWVIERMKNDPDDHMWSCSLADHMSDMIPFWVAIWTNSLYGDPDICAALEKQHGDWLRAQGRGTVERNRELIRVIALEGTSLDLLKKCKLEPVSAEKPRLREISVEDWLAAGLALTDLKKAQGMTDSEVSEALIWGSRSSEVLSLNVQLLFPRLKCDAGAVRSTTEAREIIQRETDKWMSAFGRLPAKPSVFKVSYEWTDLTKLKKNFKFFLDLVKGQEDNEHTAENAARVASLFGARSAGWVKCVMGDVHDAGMNLSPDMPPEAIEFLWEHRHLKGKEFKSALAIANAWNELQAVLAGKPATFAELSILVKTRAYEAVKHQGFAVQASEADVSPDDYLEYETRWLKGLAKLKVENIPMVSYTFEGYTLKRLAKDDPRDVFAGYHADCCQHPNGAGDECAWHGHESPNGAIFIVENNDGEIIGTSWAWRNRHVVVFDNIELLGKRPTDRIVTLYTEVAKRLVAAGWGIHEVNVGTRRNDVPLDGWTDPYGGGCAPVPQEVDYTDAARQYRIYKDPDCTL